MRYEFIVKFYKSDLSTFYEITSLINWAAAMQRNSGLVIYAGCSLAYSLFSYSTLYKDMSNSSGFNMMIVRIIEGGNDAKINFSYGSGRIWNLSWRLENWMLPLTIYRVLLLSRDLRNVVFVLNGSVGLIWRLDTQKECSIELKQ